MIPKECKRLAEVDFPIAVVSKHSARDLPAAPHGGGAGRRHDAHYAGADQRPGGIRITRGTKVALLLAHRCANWPYIGN